MSETTTKPRPYTVEDLPVNQLEIDRRVQRQGLNLTKVRRIAKNYNPAALGIVTVSFRKDRSYVVIDGGHRTEATRIVTDNTGTLVCHVFKDLTLAEEVQMFLDLNDTTQPPKIDKYLVLRSGEGPDADAARDIAELLGNYGWQISRVAANGNINAVDVVNRMYQLSQKMGSDPNLILMAIMTITKAWGNDRNGAQGPLFEALCRLYAEYGSKLDYDHLVDILKHYQGGPRSLIAEGQQLGAVRKMKTAMAIADIVVNTYNRGRRTKQLEAWRKRT
jgi:hypothetical protein